MVYGKGENTPCLKYAVQYHWYDCQCVLQQFICDASCLFEAGMENIAVSGNDKELIIITLEISVSTASEKLSHNTPG